MAAERKANYVFYERRVRNEKEIESLLLGDESLEENGEWVVQKSAKKSTATPDAKSRSRPSPSLKSPRKATENGIVSPIKIKRKLSYAVNKVETGNKNRRNIVSPIIIKRLPDCETVAIKQSLSACSKKPTIELTSSEDEGDNKKSTLKRKIKKRNDSADTLDDSDREITAVRTSPKKRIHYFEDSGDDELDLCKSNLSSPMLRRTSRSSKNMTGGDVGHVKKTPSRKCKHQQNSMEGSSIAGLWLPLSRRTPVKAQQDSRVPAETPTNATPSKERSSSTNSANGTPDNSTRETETENRLTRTSSRKCSKKNDADGSKPTKTGMTDLLNALVKIESMDMSPIKATFTPNKSKDRTPLKSLANRNSSKSDRGTISEEGALRVLNALEAVESMEAIPINGSSNPQRVSSPRHTATLPGSPAKLSNSSRKSRRKLDEAFDLKCDADDPSPSKKPIPSGAPTPNSTRLTRSGNNSPSTTSAKMESLHSADALSQADATPVKGSTPGKVVSGLVRTPAKGTTPSKATTPAKPSSVVIPLTSSDDEDELATPLRRSSKRAAKTRSSPKVETPLRRSSRTPSKVATPVRRSTRVSMSPSTPSLRQKVLLANTPRHSLPPLMDEDESEDEFVTPRKTPISAKKKLDMTPSTPSSCRKVGHGFLSPVVAERERRGPSTPSSDLGVARAQLHVSTLPKSLPCREKEFNDIKNFIIRKLSDGTGGCMYISGCPGTGKTATVHTVVRTLQKMSEDRDLTAFDFVEVNGLRLTEPRQAYVRIWQSLSKNKVTPDQALSHLEIKFNGKPRRSTVLLVDELDYLCNRRQDVIYNILDWTTKRCSKLVVLTIANTMDLPERTLKGKITSRMGLTRLGFQSYNFHQLEEIVLNRLDGCKAFNRDAVQLVARKVAAVSGDARRALDICRRSTEILESEGRTNVSVMDIQRVLTQIFAGSRVQAVKNCSTMAKLVLRSIRDEVERTGVEETTVAFIHPQLVAICALEGKREPAITDLLSICTKLAECGLIFAEKTRKGINRKISLNVNPDDIHYAINC